MKYAVTEILSNLFFELIKEFSEYQSKTKENKNDPLLNEIFINDKISQCNNEKKIMENNIGFKIANKKNIVNDLYVNISDYTKQYDNSINIFYNNLNNLLQILNNEEKDYKLTNITEDLIEDINQLSLNIISIDNKNKELIGLLNEVNEQFIYKMELIDNIITIINESYNNTIVVEELNCDENILYCESRNKHSSSHKNKKNAPGDNVQTENDKFLQEWI